MLAQGYGGWWFDMWGGWFSAPELLNVLAKGQTLYEEFPSKVEVKMQPQVCVIVDEDLCFWDASYGKLASSILINRYPLAKTGAPYDLFLRTDLDKIDLSHYRVIWLMGVVQLNSKELQKIKEWRKNGVMVLYTNETGTNVDDIFGRESFYKGKLSWSETELRKLWKDAGVHIYLDTDDVFYIGRSWLCIHTTSGGKREIKLPFYAKVMNPLNHQSLADSTNSIEINLAPKSTTLLRVMPY